MKQKDIAILVAIVVVSAVISLFVSDKIFDSPQQRQQQVATVNPISSNFPTPDPKYFNDQAIDPTQQIQIGTSTNSNPFTQPQ